MSTFLRSLFKKTPLLWVFLLLCSTGVQAQQITNSNFEDWSGAAFDGNPQPKGWNASNVEQVGLKFNFAHKEAGHNGGYSMMVQDQDVGAMGITETSPGYFALGQPWAYVPSITAISQATAGTYGGIDFTYRPDTMSVWIRRTGNDYTKEDFYLLYYAWTGQTRGDKYKGKNENCTSVTYYDEESDVRQALNGNECGTTVKGTQVSEGMWRERALYNEWTNIRVPIYYMNNVAPTRLNIIFSASNYPNFRANSGLYAGNSLYVDDLELIYSSKIQRLDVGGKEWKGFDPNSQDVQTYALGESATSIPEIKAYRGAGSLTNARGTTVNFNGRELSGSEISISYGDLVSKPTTITVKAEDGKSTTTYKIQFQKAASSNAKLASISYVYGSDTTRIAGFSPSKYNYTVDLPYGTTAAPVIVAEKQEDKQTVSITQPKTLSDKAVLTVTAANGSAKATYTLDFRVAQLADNTLKDILVNGTSVPGFNPAQTVYRVSIPVGTTTMPVVKAVSAYPEGAQTIVYTAPSTIDGGTYQISVTTPGNQVAKTYKLNFKVEASSYVYLKDLQVEGGYITDFDPENTTYYVNLPMGTTEVPAITWVPGDEYQTVTKTDGGINGTTRITVTAGNGDQLVYKIIFATETSGISTLSAILIGGQPLEGFSADVKSYTYALPVGTTELPTIEVVKGDEFQTVVISEGTVNSTVRITVTADDGSTTVYQITFSVAAYTVNTLKSLSVKGFALQNAEGEEVGFDPEQNEYWVNLPQGTTELPEVVYEAQNAALQTINTRSGGINGEYRITVRPESGASRMYVIHFSVATSGNTKLAMIYVDGQPLDGFDPAVTTYTYNLPEGVSTIPAVKFDKQEESQRVLSVLEDTIQTITVTAESGAKRDYVIHFHIQLSANAFLEMIYLDGTPLAGFEPEVLNYTVQLTGDTCPVVTVQEAPGQQVTIAMPVGAGKAVIRVAPEAGAAQTYTVTFLALPSASVQLNGITVDGVAVAEFDPATLVYARTYTRTLPTVGYEKADPKQTVEQLWLGETVYLYVSDSARNSATYEVRFTRQYANNTALKTIQADGETIAGFKPEQLDYSYVLPAGSTYPVISYEKADSVQSVVAGQVSEGEWNITVIAENDDKATYTVRYTISKYGDATLENLQLEGEYEGTFAFAATTYDYTGLTIGEGAPMPDMVITTKPGQKVLSYNVSDTQQKVLVVAEDGSEALYTINYVRTQNGHALLSNILIGGKPLVGFTPETKAYDVELAQGTTVTPNVFPVAQNDKQTITTYMSRPNGVTKIHVEAQNGATADYTIAFSVKKCTNTKLGSLTIDGISRDVNETEYEFELPYGSVEPYEVEYTKAEAEQMIEYAEAPISGVTRIIVTDENGDKRTYSIRYKVAEPQGENIITKIRYQYVTKTSALVNDSIVPVLGDNVVELPYGAKSFSVTSYEKSYDEQSVVFYNGGIRRGATIIANANKDGVEDAVYTVTPKMPEFDTKGKLKELKFKGALIPNFRPDVYNYVINVTAQPTAANFTTSTYDGKPVSKSSPDAKKKQITLTVSGGEKYTVCWYYTTYDKLLDFSEDWVAVSQGVGYKPSAAWTVPGDCSAGYTWGISGIVNLTYTTGKEVTPGGSNGVMLSTLRGAPMNGSVPGMMTLGEMSVSLTSNGNSTSSVTKSASVGAAFKNTPEALAFKVKPLSTSSITNWKLWLTMSDGSNYAESNYTGDFSALNSWQDVSVPISYTGVGTVSKFNIMLSSCDQENAKQFGGNTIYESSVMYDQIHFVYNSELTAATVDGAAATKDGNTFTKTVSDDYIGVPALKFTGKVHDQTQKIEWLNNGEWVNGELTAKVVNYGENANTDKPDSTIYNVVLKRSAVTSTDYTIDWGTYTETPGEGDTVYVEMPYGTKALPDVAIEPTSVHQLFAISKKGNIVKVTVTPESGAAKTTVYVFREQKSTDAGLQMFSLTDAKNNEVLYETVDAEHFIYRCNTTRIPTMSYVKSDECHQYVDLRYTNDSIVLTVTAEDGVSKRTYTIRREEAAVTTNGQIKEFYLDDEPIAGFGGATNTDYEAVRPTEVLTFVRQFDRDSVVFVQSPTNMVWQVYGDANKTYTWTYPTVKSANAMLADVLVDGVSFEAFDASLGDYTTEPIETTGNAQLLIVPGENNQTIVSTQTADSTGVNYAIVVTAEDGVTKMTYKLRVARPVSADATLAAIYVDGEAIADFDPAVADYTVVLPSPAVKREQPQMPSITYEAGHVGQTIELALGGLGADEPTTIFVKAENGKTAKQYNVQVVAEKSHCASLTGILVNGTPLEGFESGRRYYSTEVNTSEIVLTYAADDRFLKVDTSTQGTDHMLTVTAEDGTTTFVYHVNVYVKAKSNDATLSSILLNGVEFVNYERALNPTLTFKPDNLDYTINLPSGSTVLPKISAQLKMEGQQVEVKSTAKNVMTVTVTAEDGVTKKTYTLTFEVPKSTNTNLSMIFLNGDSLQGFAPDHYVYFVELPVGQHTLPEVAGQKSEPKQQVDTIVEAQQVTLKVKAENTTYEATYVVSFQFTQSDADTLKMIYADGVGLPGFEPKRFYYVDSLPVGTVAFPELSWEECDEWQKEPVVDTVQMSASSLTRQIRVTAESGKSNTYTVAYVIRKSDVDTLQGIFIDTKALSGFNAQTMEYYYTLTAKQAQELAGSAPQVEVVAGDEYQSVFISQTPDSLDTKSLGIKTLITVTAATGATRTYIIHYPVQLSSEATLNLIMLSGRAIDGFDAERTNYKQTLSLDADLPLVTYSKKEEVQEVDLEMSNDTVRVIVIAEDRETTVTYTIVFEREKSNVTLLRDIILTAADSTQLPTAMFAFRPETNAYTISIPYDPNSEAVLPRIDVVLYDSLQVVKMDTLELDSIIVTVHVIAPNGVDENEYTLTFKFGKNNDARLTAITLGGKPLADFDSQLTEYTYVWPFGSDSTNFFTTADLAYELSDTKAADTAWVDQEGTIFIRVIAHDGVTEQTYIIRQTVGKDSDCYLSAIYLDSVLIRDFDLETMFYTYCLYDSAAVLPTLTAEARSQYAEVSVGMYTAAGDTCEIICTADDGTERRYYVHFAVMNVTTGAVANSNDVLIKRMPGSLNLLVATIRNDVKIALYDQNGRLLLLEDVPVANANDAQVSDDPITTERLSDVVDPSSGLVIPLIPGQIYQYSFFVAGGTKRIKSGKFIALP